MTIKLNTLSGTLCLYLFALHSRVKILQDEREQARRDETQLAASIVGITCINKKQQPRKSSIHNSLYLVFGRCVVPADGH